MTLTLPGLLSVAVERAADKDAVVFPSSRQTYSEVWAGAAAIAKSLIALGIGKGDSVGVLMPNIFDHVHAIFGIAQTGAKVVLVNARLSPRELAFLVPDSGMRVLLTTDTVDQHANYVDRLTAAFPSLLEAPMGETPAVATAPQLEMIVMMGSRTSRGVVSREAFMARGEGVSDDDVRARAAAVAEEDPCTMMYTSGTTAMPVGCTSSHLSILRAGRAFGREVWRLGPADRVWDPLPMFHVSAICPMVAAFDAAVPFITMTHFEATPAIEQIESEKASVLFAAYPTIVQPLLYHSDATDDTFKAVRSIFCIAPKDTLRKFQDRLPHTKIVSAYGSTETSGMAVMGRLEDPLDERVTCGKPFEGVEILIKDPETGEPAATGVTGEIGVRGWNVFMGYHNHPERNLEAFDDAGWFWTGDLGSVDESGNLTYQGRTKDMLKVGGENVGALEVESYLATHAAVAIAAVVGRPDSKYVEVPVAFVELVAGQSVEPAELLAYCREGLAKYKVPVEINIVKGWPMSSTKIQKFRLLEEAALWISASSAAP